MKRIIFSLAAIVMLLPLCLASCQNKTPTAPTDTRTDSTEESQAPVTEDYSKVFEVPKNLNAEPKTFSVLRYNSSVPEFGTTQEKPDSVDMALFNRDEYVQEYLNIELSLGEPVNGQYADRTSFVQTVENGLQSGSPWDMIAAYSFIPPALTIRGLLRDLNSEGYVNTEKAWWPDYMVDACEINGKAYYLSGDISSNLLYYMQGILFNMSEATNNRIDIQEDLYQKVYDGKWTLEYFFELTENISRDPDGDGWDDEDNLWAIGMESATVLDSFYTALGLRLFEKDEDGLLRVSPDITSEKTMLIYDTVSNAISNHTMKIPTSGAPLRDGTCVFGIYTIYQMRTTLAEMVTNLGVLPFPKYSETDDYRTLISNPHTEYCIPHNIADMTLSTAVMETMAYESYQSVTPVIYETTMKRRYSESPDNAAMFDILRAGATYDIGIFYYMSFPVGVEPGSMFRNALQKKETSWMTYYRQNFKDQMQSVVDDLNALFSQRN